ncbi:MAG: hypothetical protein Q4B63_06775 [Clostridium perfringens]|nr:hypothetical protein [Clostridium perfringens]
MNLQTINLIITMAIMATLIIINNLHIKITKKGLKRINEVLKDIAIDSAKAASQVRGRTPMVSEIEEVVEDVDKIV